MFAFKSISFNEFNNKKLPRLILNHFDNPLVKMITQSLFNQCFAISLLKIQINVIKQAISHLTNISLVTKRPCYYINMN
jgi:hypothetical protein